MSIHFYTVSSRCVSHISHVCLRDWFWPGGMGVPGCVATGLASTGVLGSEDKLSVNFFSSIPIGIRSGELNLPLMCSNSCTCIKEIWLKSRENKLFFFFFTALCLLGSWAAYRWVRLAGYSQSAHPWALCEHLGVRYLGQGYPGSVLAPPLATRKPLIFLLSPKTMEVTQM